MVVKFDANKPFKLIESESDIRVAKCFLCGRQADSRIYYDCLDNGNCICFKCENDLKGIFKDYLLATSNFNESTLVEMLDKFNKETLQQLKRHSEFKGYKYCREVDIVDYFDDTYFLEEIQQSNIFYSWKYEYCYNQMIKYMEETYNEKPFVVKFFKTPDYYDEEGEYLRESDAICGIAKINNNGTTVIFGDSKIVLERSKYNNYDDHCFETKKCIE